MNALQETQIRKAKDRLNAAAVRCLCGDRSAIKEADEAMSQIKQLWAERQAAESSGEREAI